MFQVNEVVNHNNRPWIIFEIISPEAASQHQIFWIVNDDDEEKEVRFNDIQTQQRKTK